MNHVEALFALAKRLASSAGRLSPPLESGILSPRLHGLTAARHFLIGTERQFHTWSREIRQRLVRGMFAFNDRVAERRQDDGLAELVGQFFRESSDLPALIWASAVWVRTGNWLQRVGLVGEDESCSTQSHAAHSPAHRTCSMEFGNGEAIALPIGKLHFFYPEPSQTLLLTPRFRKILTPTGRQVGFGYEQGLGLGNSDEVVELKHGHYSPNDLFTRAEHDINYFELLTATFARLFPDPPTAIPDLGRSAYGGRWSGRMRGLHIVPANDLANGYTTSMNQESNLPKRAMVRFVRITFNPVDLSIVVVLTAEREFDRFVTEHDGLGQLLYERFAVTGGP